MDRGKSPIIKNILPGLPELGKIKIGRKGAKRGTGAKQWQLPEKLDHFLVTTLERGSDNNFLKDTKIHKSIGDKPKSIPVRLLYDEIDLNFQCRYTCYFGKTLYCSGDGEFCHQIVDKTGNRDIKPCPCHRSEPTFNGDKDDGKGKCKINGVVSVLIDASKSVGGVYKFRTTGYNSTIGILSSLTLIKSLSGGVLAGLPLRMTIQPKVATNPINGTAVTIYVVGIIYDGDIDSLRDSSLKIAQADASFRARLGHVEDEARKLISVDTSLIDEAGDIVDEYMPEERGGTVPKDSEPPKTINKDIEIKPEEKPEQKPEPVKEPIQEPVTEPEPESTPEPEPEPTQEKQQQSNEWDGIFE